MDYAAAERVVAQLPGVTEGARYGNRTWFVGKRAIAWERPLSKADLRRLGDEPPPVGDILAIAVADLGEKEALLAQHPDTFFTIQHFAGHPTVLVTLASADPAVVAEALADAHALAAG